MQVATHRYYTTTGDSSSISTNTVKKLAAASLQVQAIKLAPS
jgi:hypothetical protein